MGAPATRPFVPNRKNPWHLPDAAVAHLLTHTSVRWDDLQVMPLRTIRATLDYLYGRNAFAPRPRPSIMDTGGMTPDQFKRMVEGG